jgi:hypothetical protein
MKPNREQLAQALHATWGSDTCVDTGEWTADNPARGQCVPSSLVVQDYEGGDLRRYEVTLPDGSHEKHYCNVLQDGTEEDTTRVQYIGPISLRVDPVDLKGFGSVREKRLAEPVTRAKYELLRDRVAHHLATLGLGLQD